MNTMACDGVRQRRQLRRLTRHKIASRYRTLTAEGATGPPEASDVRGDDGGGPCAVSDGAEVPAIVNSCMRPCKAVKPIYVCRKVPSSPRVSYFRYAAVKNW